MQDETQVQTLAEHVLYALGEEAKVDTDDGFELTLECTAASDVCLRFSLSSAVPRSLSEVCLESSEHISVKCFGRAQLDPLPPRERALFIAGVLYTELQQAFLGGGSLVFRA